MKLNSLNRRHFLRGIGACLSLPAFEALSGKARAAAPAFATTASGAPQRMAFIYFPNGAIHDQWWPTGTGSDFKLGNTLAPLENLKHRLQVVSGFAHKNAEAGNDGAGDHARANGTFLTGVRVKKTAGSDIHAGVSIDQIAAQHIGQQTRFASLELSTDPHRKSGGCDSGYSCAYEANLAFVLDDAKSVQQQLTHRDNAKLDEYLTGVREIEQRITAAERFTDSPDPAMETPAGIPAAYDQYIRLMFEMMALSFETDSTRVASLLLAHDGSNRAFGEIGIAEGHHSLSHHRNDPDMIAKVARIDRFYVEQLAAFLTALETKKDADGTSILHNSTIIYGCGNSDGNRHTHDNLPIVLAGSAGGKLNPGRFLQLEDTPMCNLYLNMLDHMGVPGLDRFGDSTGRLANI